jgi:Tfp pilus assembly protein PilO
MMSHRTWWGNDVRYTLHQPGVRRGLALLAVALILLIVSGIQYHRIVTNEIGGLRDELDQKRREAVDTHYAKELVAAFSTGKKQMAVLEKKLLVQGVQSTLVHEIEKLCRLNAVKVLGQSYQDGKMEGSNAVLQHELAVAGSYYNLRRLIRDIEKLPTLSFIEEASFSKLSERDAGLKLTLRLSTYYRVEAPKLVN